MRARLLNLGTWGALALSGCTSVPQGRTTVDAVDVSGARAVSESDLTDKIATAATPKFLGLFRGVIYEYSVFDRFVLERDLLRLERLYAARGYYEARAHAARIHAKSDGHVRVEIVVEEGEPVRVRTVALEGLPPELEAATRVAVSSALRVGAPFEEAGFDSARKAVERALGDGGYAYATIAPDAVVDVHTHTADVTLRVSPGPRAQLGPVRIEGLGDLPEARVRRVLHLREGRPYSRAALEAAQQALFDLGVFGAVEVTAEITDPPPANHIVPIVVRVQPSLLHTTSFGGGVELDAFKTDVHGRAAWEHKNLFGNLERFTVDFRPGVVLFPTRVPDFQKPRYLLPEEKLALQLRRPGLFEPRTTGFVSTELNVYPAILAFAYDPTQPVVGYVESKESVGVERRFARHVLGSLSHVVQVSDPFAYLGTLGSFPGALVVSYPRLYASLDYRDNVFEPHAGAFLGAELQAAGVFGQPRDLRFQPEARGYVPLGPRVTLGLRATVGFLFPFNYDASTGGAASADQSARDQQIVYFRGFFSGGPTSNRGYPLRGVGPQGSVRFLDAGLSAQQVRQNCQNTAGNDPACLVPLGGVTLWEATTEVRVPIAGPFSEVTFCDTSDVSATIGEIRLNRLHLSCGIGFRYATPVGPVRLDAGYRIPGLQIIGEPDPFVFGALFSRFPLALQFGIGEAF